MSFLAMAKAAEARLTTPVTAETPYAIDAVNAVSLPRAYAHPWPDAIPDLGPRQIAPFDACARCTSWSWARYGDLVLCLPCARRALE
jgi:hypothetical protein